MMTKYEDLLEGPKSKRIMNAHIAGVAFGYSVCIRFFFIGILFYVGAIFIVQYKLAFKEVYQAQYILFMSAMGAGFAVS